MVLALGKGVKIECRSVNSATVRTCILLIWCWCYSAATVEKPACEQTEWFDREMKGKQVLPHGQLTSSSSTGEETELLSMPPDNVEANRQDYLDKREMRESGVSTAYSRSSAVLRQRGSTSGLGSSAGKAHVPEFLLVKDCVSY
jgi:hypothetical protein